MTLKRENWQTYLASIGFGLIGERDRFSQDKKYYFEPAAYHKLKFDLAHYYLDAFPFGDPSGKVTDKFNAIDLVASLTRSIRRNELPLGEYICKIKLGQKIENFAGNYHAFKRYQIAKKLKAKKNETIHFTVVEKNNGVDAVRVNPGEELKDFVPSHRYYLQLMFEKGKGLPKMLNALYLSNPEYNKDEKLFMSKTLDRIENGNWTEEELGQFKLLHRNAHIRRFD